MAFAQTASKGNMGVIVGLLVLFVMGSTWNCDARELMTTGPSGRETTSDISVLQINHLESEGEVKASKEVGSNENVCTMCEKFFAEAIAYLEANTTQIEITDILYETCSRLPFLEEQCTTLVDYYVPLFFLEIGSVQPKDFCLKLDLCEEMVISSHRLPDECEICHHAVAEVLLKLKDPDTQLDLIRSLLKVCDTVGSYVKLKKCKTLVMEFGPLILIKGEKFLEKADICSAIHACDSPSAGVEQTTPVERTSLLSAL